MPEIREIQIRNLDIPQIPDWMNSYPQTLPPIVPVTQNIGTPIVDLPGCVESHPDAGKSKTLAQDDPNGVMTYCDGTIPSFNPMDYSPEDMTIERSVPPPKVEAPETPELPKTPEIPKQENTTANIGCPTASQQAKEPVGTLIEGYRKKVTGYQLIGNECIQITEKVPLPTQIIAGLPSPGAVMTTGGIAVVATGSALMAKPLADLLLKAVKPTVKKVMKKIAAIRGKEEVFLSVAERRAEQRERNQAIKELRSALKPKG
jgi:hypothetical protein